jgi:hypothetical protein
MLEFYIDQSLQAPWAHVDDCASTYRGRNTGDMYTTSKRERAAYAIRAGDVLERKMRNLPLDEVIRRSHEVTRSRRL